MYAPSKPQSCDTFVALPPATANGCIIFGKNSDRPDDEVQEVEYFPAMEHHSGSKVMCTYIEIDQVATTNAVILSKPAWMWGAEMGANEHGVCIGNEAIWSKMNSEDDLTERLLGMDMVRLVLERVKTAKEGVELIGELLTKYGQGGPCFESKAPSAYQNSFLLADRTEAWVMETAGRHWAAEHVKDGVRNISNQLSIGTQMDLMSEDLVDYAKSLGFYAETQGKFNFTKTFSDDDCIEGRFAHGKRMMKEFSKEGQFSWLDMANILRDENSGICMTGGYESTGSQISVVQPLTSDLPAVHWFTGTPNPKNSIFKPFVFTPDADIGSLCISPKFGADDPRIVKPRFQKEVDRRHKLYIAHQNFFTVAKRKVKHGVKPPCNIHEFEDKIFQDMEVLLQDKSCGTLSTVFTNLCEQEYEFYCNMD